MVMWGEGERLKFHHKSRVYRIPDLPAGWARGLPQPGMPPCLPAAHVGRRIPMRPGTWEGSGMSFGAGCRVRLGSAPRFTVYIMCGKRFAIMEYVYAALLLHKLQKDVNEDNLKAVVSASGADVNEAQVKSLVAALADVDIDEAVKAAPVAVAAAAAPAAEEPAAEEPKEKEKEEEKDEEAAMEGLSSLFG